MLIHALTPIYSSFTQKTKYKSTLSSSNPSFGLFPFLLIVVYLSCWMASGSSKGFDFASDDLLCDYANRENSIADSPIDSKEFHKNRMARTPVFSYTPTNDSDNQRVILLSVERSMKKHTDNVMRFLEGLSSRLSQLELYCYNLDKSIGEMRSDLTQDHEESDAKLKFLEKHVEEVHRSVQILRDKQELADTQKELAKLQLAQKESSLSSSCRNSQQQNNNDDRSSTPDPQKLALVPAPQPPQAYYMSPGHTLVNQIQYPLQSQLPQSLPQQWTPQVQPQQSIHRPSSPQVYLPAKPQPSPLPSSMPMPYSAVALPYTLPQQQLKVGFGGPPMVYDNAAVRHPAGQGGQFYPPPTQQQSGGGGGMMQQSVRNHHPYNEVIDKLVSMGYRGDHVVSVIQRLDESGLTVDFNTVLDRLNGGGWSG